MRHPVWLVPLLALAALRAPAAQAAVEKPFFPMGVWYEGGAGPMRDNLIPADPKEAAALYKRDFQDIARHGVNCAVVPNTPPAHHKALLDAARAAKLRLIIELGANGGRLGDKVRGAAPVSDEAIQAALDSDLKPILGHPALWRVQLIDEPQPEAFGRYARVARGLREYARGLEPFCCLIGSGDFDGFLTTTLSNVAAFDCYPIMHSTAIGDTAPLKAFEAQATAAGLACARRNADPYAVIQAHTITGIHRFPEPAELRCMTYLSLATGSRGVFWFLYQTEWWNKEKGETMDGLVDSQYRPRPLWDEVGRLTKEIAALAPTLQTLRPDATPGAVESDQTAHLLRDASGLPYVFAVNLDTTRARTVGIRFRNDQRYSGVQRIGPKARLRPRQEAGWLLWSDTLPPGGGGLYRLD